MRSPATLSAMLLGVACASSAPSADPARPSAPVGLETPAIPGSDVEPPAPPPLPVVEQGGAKVGLPVGSEAPTFSLKALNPQAAKRAQLALGDHVGKGAKEPRRAVLLSFAASYCGPCKQELRELAREERRLRDAGVLTAVVVIDTEDAGIAAMRAFLLDELKLDFPVLGDRFAILARRYRAEALPYVVLVDRQGKIAWSHAGYDPSALSKALAALR